MKTERITLLASTEFKAFLMEEARAEDISISELIRRRCEQRQNEDEQLLLALAAELREATAAADKALDAGLASVESARAAIRQSRSRAQYSGAAS
jgi:hypothetical protein